MNDPAGDGKLALGESFENTFFRSELELVAEYKKLVIDRWVVTFSLIFCAISRASRRLYLAANEFIFNRANSLSRGNFANSNTYFLS